jgi:hypothetical protein
MLCFCPTDAHAASLLLLHANPPWLLLRNQSKAQIKVVRN